MEDMQEKDGNIARLEETVICFNFLERHSLMYQSIFLVVQVAVPQSVLLNSFDPLSIPALFTDSELLLCFIYLNMHSLCYYLALHGFLPGMTACFQAFHYDAAPVTQGICKDFHSVIKS